MAVSGKKLGVLVSAAPSHPNFAHGIKLAAAALAEGVDVYLYCIDNAVTGAQLPELQGLKSQGLKVFACAYAAQRRALPLSDAAVFSGLGMVTDIISATDRFVSFN